MPPSRRVVLAALLGVVALVTAAILSRVLVTVFFAITVAYVLVPVDRRLRARGVRPWWSGAAVTATAFVAGLLIFVPFAVVLYLRRAQLFELIALVPDRFAVAALGFTYAVELSDLTAMTSRYVQGVALSLVRAAPILAAKLIVFGFVVFGLVLRRDEVRRGLLAPLPAAYHDVVLTVHERVRDTLFALYVIQAVTAFATFLVALPIFVAFGYGFPVTLALLAGLLQFLPVVGPSLVVIGIALFEAGVGAFGRAILILVVGLLLIGFLPDAVLRPRLARRTAGLPASLYFVGFTGGVLGLGAVGIIAGPLAIAVLVEVVSLLAAEMSAGGYRR